MSAPTLADWAAYTSLAVGVHAAYSVPYFLLVDADLSAFDPRPAVRRAVDSGRLDPALITVTNTRQAVTEAMATALLILALHLPKGATR